MIIISKTEPNSNPDDVDNDYLLTIDNPEIASQIETGHVAKNNAQRAAAARAKRREQRDARRRQIRDESTPIPPPGRRNQSHEPLQPGVRPVVFRVSPGIDLTLFPAEQRMYAAYVLHTIRRRTRRGHVDANGYVRLKYKYLIKIIPREFLSPIIQRLRRDGGYWPHGPIVDVDYTVTRGVKSRGYRLGAAYRTNHRITCTDNKLSNRIHRVFGVLSARPIHRDIAACAMGITFDPIRARQIIATMEPPPGTGLTTDEYRNQMGRRYGGGINPRMVVDKFGRVHTGFTSCPRALRCCLSVDGKPLVGIDVRNMQLLMLGLLIRRMLASRQSERAVINDTFPLRDIYRVRNVTQYHPRPGEPADLTEYMQRAADGSIYDDFVTPKHNRKWVKQRLLIDVLMGPNRITSDLKDVFTKRFPTVAKYIARIKVDGHARMAHHLQNLESTIMINGAARRLMAANPRTPFITVHDAIYTTAEHVDAATAAITDALREFGTAATFNTEPVAATDTTTTDAGTPTKSPIRATKPPTTTQPPGLYGCMFCKNASISRFGCHITPNHMCRFGCSGRGDN